MSTAPNMQDAIQIPKDFLILTGHWPLENQSFFYYFKRFISDSIQVTFVVLLFVGLYKCKTITDITDHLSLLVSPTSYMLKLLWYKRHGKDLMELLKFLESRTFNEYPEHLQGHMWASIRFSRFVGTMYQWACAIVIVNYSLFIPWITKADLPLRFPFDIGNWTYGMYVLQVLGLANAASVNSCIDVMAYSTISLGAAQLDILNGKIIEAVDAKETKEKEIIKNLSKCVEHHCKIISFIENIEQVFTEIILVQYLTSILVICNIGFQLVHVHIGSINFLNMCFYFMAMIQQLSIYCWNGNEIILKSRATMDACYNSKWTKRGTEVRRMLYIISERSKRPLSITAGKFSKLSLSTFTSVINSSYSYFTLMQRIDHKNKHQQ